MPDEAPGEAPGGGGWMPWATLLRLQLAAEDMRACQPFRVLEAPGFLSPAECAAVIALAQAKGLERSMLAGGTVSTSRTSFSTFCNASGSLSGTIRARVGELLGANQPWIGGYEDLQVVRYQAGQEFAAHLDTGPTLPKCRIATCLIYLNGRDEFGGGETHFPDLGAHGLTVSPELGKAALWLNARPSDGASLGPHARHADLKVTRGEKWVCTQWVHAGRFGET